MSFATHRHQGGNSMSRNVVRERGQGMTEYIIIVALIAVAAIGVYTAFGDIVRGQTSAAASSLAGAEAGGARNTVTSAQADSNAEGMRRKTLSDFED
jgi:Flp pilus assembly pilin Flp